MPDVVLQDYVNEGNRFRMVRLRGLPFHSGKPEIINFFRSFDVQQQDIVIEFKGGRASGRAVVQLKDEREAQRACRELHKAYLGNRYIEVDMLSHVEQEIMDYN